MGLAFGVFCWRTKSFMLSELHPDVTLAAAAALPEPSASRGAPAWTETVNLLVESTGEGIFGVDILRRCPFMNRAGAEMLGWSTRQVLGRSMHWLIHHSHADGQDYPEAACPIFNAFRRGLPCRIDSEVLWRADDSWFRAEYSSYSVFDGLSPCARN